MISKKTIIGAILIAYSTQLYLRFSRISNAVEVVITTSITDLSENKDTVDNRNAAEKLVDLYSSYGIRYPRVVLAQNIEETGHFTSRVANENKNIVGMKRSNRPFLINRKELGDKAPRDCPCFDWKLHACYERYEDGLKDYAVWQNIILTGYKNKYKRYPRNDAEYIVMLDSLWFPGDKKPRRYAENKRYRANITYIWKHKVLKYVPNPRE
jgi:Mannosyl-glycoprotein endo-beta-N-acetylglucosaminidase